MERLMIESYITQYGWTYQLPENAPDTVITGLELSNGTPILLVFQLQSSWLRISAPAFSPMPEGDDWATFAETLLMLAGQSRLVKFAIDGARNLFLCVDIFTEPSLPYDQFALALDVLAHYTEATHQTLTLAGAQNPV